MFSEEEETRIRFVLKGELPGTTTTATTTTGEKVEVWFSFDGSLNMESIKSATFD